MSATHSDDRSTEPRTGRAFLFGRDTPDPRFDVKRRFQNQYGDQRTAIETPAPWDTPDGMTSANELVKDLDWDDHHQTFEDELPRFDLENVWVLDESGVDPLREAAEAEGYQWIEAGHDAPTTADEGTLGAAAGYAEEADVDWDGDNWEFGGGDDIAVRYESKQTGGVKSKEGVVTAAENPDHPGARTGIAFKRDDGKTNKVLADNGEVGIYSTSQYPFMGRVLSVEVTPR